MRNTSQHKSVRIDPADPAAMKVNRFTLRFADSFADYESEFQRRYMIQSLRPLRFAILMAMIVWGSFGFLDLAIDREHISLLWGIRYGIVIPIILLGLLASYLSLFEKLMQPIIALAILIIGGSVIAMITVADAPLRHTYYAGLILIFMFAYTMIRMRFFWATISCWVLVIAYEVVAVTIETPQPILLSNSFFFIGANFFGMTACYLIELASRRDFFLVTQLKEERKKVARPTRSWKQISASAPSSS